MTHQHTLKGTRGTLDNLPLELTNTEKLQAKLDVAHDLLHSEWERNRAVGKRIEAEVVTAVLHELQSSLPTVVTWQAAMAKREQDFNRRYYGNLDGLPEWRYD